MERHSDRVRPGRLGTVAILATAALAFLAACGGGSPPSADGATGGSSASAVAYSACMRSHGVPSYPDPGSAGQIPKPDASAYGVSASRFQAAQQACAQFFPTVGSTQEQQQETACAMSGGCSPDVVAEWMNGLRSLAACLRTHGQPNWPDPVLTSPGIPHFNYDQAGIDHHSSQVLAQVNQCIQITGFEGLPLP